VQFQTVTLENRNPMMKIRNGRSETVGLVLSQEKVLSGRRPLNLDGLGGGVRASEVAQQFITPDELSVRTVSLRNSPRALYCSARNSARQF